MITKKGKKILQTFSVLLLGGISALIVLKNYFVTTYEWIMAGFYQLASFLFGEKNVDGSIGTLFSERFWTIPDSIIGIIFGTGHSTIDIEYIPQTDVGYVNYLWILGIFGSFILYSILLMTFYYSKSMKGVKRNKVYERLKLYFLFMMFLGNIKFDVFTYGPSIMLFFLVYYLEILDQKQTWLTQNKISYY